MVNWTEFAAQSHEISEAGRRMLARYNLAFLATVSASGRPRIHPFVPKVVDGRLIAFILDTSPKQQDLRVRRQYAIHTLPGKEDEEFTISGD